MAEKKKWIKGATENSHGQFRKKAEHAGKSTLAFAHDHETDEDRTGKQARLAENLIKAAHHSAHKTNKASASHKTIRTAMYGHKE